MHANRKMTSTWRYVPFSTSAQTSAAAMGTAMYLLTPKICMEAATPANSATTLARSTKKPVTITKNVGRNPNSSRIKSDNPLPVMTPMRAHISSVTYSAMVIGISDHSSAYPYFAPACVYTEIPPASLSTLEVIRPGPITASSMVSRWRSARRRFCRSLPRVLTASTRVVMASQFMAFPTLPPQGSRYFTSSLVRYFLTSRDTTSSTVMVPIGRPSLLVTVSMRKLYLSNSSKTSFSSASPGTPSSGSVLSSDMRCSGSARSRRDTGTVPENLASESSSTIVSS